MEPEGRIEQTQFIQHCPLLASAISYSKAKNSTGVIEKDHVQKSDFKE